MANHPRHLSAELKLNTLHRCFELDKINNAVVEVIGKLVNNPKFENKIRTKVGNNLDTKDLEKEYTNLKEQLK